MTGGRLCVENSTGIYLWVNRDGMAAARHAHGKPGHGKDAPLQKSLWERHSITAAHNEGWKGDSSLLFTSKVNSSLHWQTMSYTSILQTGPKTAAVFYQV